MAAQAAAAQPQVILSLGDTDPEAVRVKLDPLGLDGGPPVVPLAELTADGRLGPSAVRRLALVLEHRAMRRRLGELEAIVASQALSAFRDTETIRLEWLDPVQSASSLPPTDAQTLPDDAPEAMVRHYERLGDIGEKWWEALR